MTNPIDLTKPIAPVVITMVDIPAGSFLMGSPENEDGRFSDEEPQHEVRLKAYRLSATPITQSQWREVALWNPLPGESWGCELDPDPSAFKDDNLPVTNVSWHDAMEFCSRISQRTGRKISLPSEARWEHACRAGTTTAYSTGDDLTTDQANFDGRSTGGQYIGQPTDVYKYPPNPWGLHDMHGNVFEWCLDDWHKSYHGAPADGSAWID